MGARPVRIALTAALLLTAGTAAAEPTWPHGERAAVVLTYDDSLDSQLDHAVPALDAAKLKGTFFLANVKTAQVARWRKAAMSGHELGNHSLFHPCRAAAYQADPRYTAEAYTPETMVREIAAQEALLTAIDGRTTHGYAAPCGEETVGGKPYLPALGASRTVGYIRVTEETDADLRRPPARVDPWRIPAMAFPSDATGADLIAAARRAEAGGGLLVIVFHGVGGDYLQTSTAAHRELVAWLAAHRRTVWTPTMGEAVAWIRRVRR